MKYIVLIGQTVTDMYGDTHLDVIESNSRDAKKYARDNGTWVEVYTIDGKIVSAAECNTYDGTVKSYVPPTGELLVRRKELILSILYNFKRNQWLSAD